MKPKLKRVTKPRTGQAVRRNPPRKSRPKPAKSLSKVLRSHPIGGIPNEILNQILCRCDEATLRTAMRTCRRWHSVINETIGVSIAIGKPSASQRKPPVAFQPIEVIERVGVKHCYVGDLTDVQGCPFGFPQTVRNIVFDGPITKFNLVTLLAPLSGLTNLTMHYVSLENAKIFPSTLCTTTLKSLRVTSHGIGDDYDRNKTVSILKNLISLLMSIHSQQLAILILDIINMPFYDCEVTKAIFTVLLRHKGTMKNVQFYNFAERLDPEPPGTDTERESYAFVKDEVVTKAIQEAVYLKRISYGGKRDMESDEAWNLLIQSQQSLQEMFYMNDNRDVYATWMPCLLKNSATLRKTLFHISGVDESRNTVWFDCKLLKNFQQLSHLLIRGRKVVFPSPNQINQGGDNIAIARIIMKAPVLKNIQFVPNTVTVFSMRDICVETESLMRFSEPDFIPHMRKFRLVECGSLGEYGIKPETLVELLKREILYEIEIIRSFSLINWDNATGKDIYEDALFYRIKSEWEFHAEKNCCDQYCTKEEPMFNYGRFETALRAEDVCEVVFQ